MKISYSCLPNMSSVLAKHNQKILNSKPSTERSCNCRGGIEACPVGGQCLTESIIYSAEVFSLNESKVYLGSTEHDFKARYTSHKSDFNLQNKENSTTLSSHVWSLQRKDVPYTIKWKIVARSSAYTAEARRCALCTAEKVRILFYPKGNLLNKRSEIMNKCRHKARHKLGGKEK